MEEFQIKYFAEKLKKIAKSDFGGVGKLAEILSMSQSHLSKYTGAKQEPSISFAYKLAKLNVDINKLLTGESYMSEGIQKQIDELKENFEARITNLEAELYRKDKRIKELESDKETLLSQVSSLNKIVHNPKIVKNI